MTQLAIRGSTQIMDGSIPLTKLVGGYQIPTANLQDGTGFLRYDGSVLPVANLPLNNYRITGLADPADQQDAVNLRTVMALVNGVSIRVVRAVFDNPVTLSGVQNPPGVTGLVNDEVLLTDQAALSENGPWVMKTGAWTRPAWWSSGSIQKATLVLVQEGSWGDTKFLCVTDGNITVDSSASVWVQDSSGGAYTNGNGLSLTGNIFAVKAGNGIEFDGSQNIRLRLDGSSLALGSAGIKIADGAPGSVLLANTSGEASWIGVSGDATISSTGVVQVSTNTTTGFLKYTNAVFNETPAGVINGINVLFSLASIPVPGSERVYFNGQRMNRGVGNDYTISGASITMLFSPEPGDVLLVDYLK